MEFVQEKELTEFIESQNEIKKQIDDYIIKFNEISFNISYEEISEEGLSKIKAAYEGKPIEYLQEKIINLHKQINKDRIIVKNQREELYKLNLKLQKCISFEEYNEIIDFKNQIIRELENENYLNKSKLHLSSLNNVTQQKEIEQLKVENTEMGKLVNLNKSALDLAVMTKELAMNEIERKNNEIEKLKAVIEYLESKAK